MFVTVFYGIYHYKTGMMDYTNAGHNPLISFAADGLLNACLSLLILW